MKILLVVGARPNFTKIAPIIRAIKEYDDIEYKLIHTGQHYDYNMSDVFFKDLGISPPDFNFDVGSSSHAKQTAKIISAFEDCCLSEDPDIVLVVGDVNSTLACAIVVSKLEGIKLAHVEAGERSFNKKMPEEVNRIVTDSLSDYLFCTTFDAVTNLVKEGYSYDKIYLVGNVAIDNLLYNIPKLPERTSNKPYILCTIHRQSNTDNKENLENILAAIQYISKNMVVRFPIHPRTMEKIELFEFGDYLKDVKVLGPLDYRKFLYNIKHASVVLTDSGGVQVETTLLNTPCLTVREDTEWGFTLTEGTNKLVSINTIQIIKDVYNTLLDPPVCGLNYLNRRLLNGEASKRIVGVLVRGHNQ